ncbi:MAG: hypothetical protein EZS28_006102 [Streblomastix strix]|uniref:Uncharacterized protein n=1 Tax=Streblomastix strix TaxID=222440 RepID=A0A5J4WTS1_9EUKA|nr:MAG: hypothetical protein EZS28_006102 [Streblomastix strix]
MISTCGGSCEENNDVIISGICAFKDITWNYKLNEGSNTNPLLHKAANEGIEEEGGMEEIESHLFHAVDMKYAYLKEQTIQTKNQLLFHRGFYQQDN